MGGFKPILDMLCQSKSIGVKYQTVVSIFAISQKTFQALGLVSRHLRIFSIFFFPTLENGVYTVWNIHKLVFYQDNYPFPDIFQKILYRETKLRKR